MATTALSTNSNPARIGDGPCRRADRRRAFETAACWRPLGDATWRIGLVEDASRGGIRLDLAEPNTLRPGERVELRLPRVGDMTARVARATADTLGLSFDAMDDATSDRLTCLLFAGRA
ncbi:MAG TPA: PilZ domain-containing protein [Stellaceae bacterium]|nr:PilZ domain-containing protein [Stellaceae bacterium]